MAFWVQAIWALVGQKPIRSIIAKLIERLTG